MYNLTEEVRLLRCPVCMNYALRDVSEVNREPPDSQYRDVKEFYACDRCDGEIIIIVIGRSPNEKEKEEKQINSSD